MYWGDYLKDTSHLTIAQHGAYLLLIGHYWTQSKPLPDDDQQLAAITRQSVASWKKMRPVMQAFFRVERSQWLQQRIEDELTKAFSFIEKQRNNGGKGGRPRKPTETQRITQTKPTPSFWVPKNGQNGNPNHNPNETTSPLPESESSSSEISTDAARGATRDGSAHAPRASGTGFKTVAQRTAELAASWRAKQ